MFIYIKERCRSLHRKCVINKVSLKGGFYFEISFRNTATKRKIAKAIQICDKSEKLPIVCDNIPLNMREQRRRLDPQPFNLFLLINAFCHIIKGCDRALIIDRNGMLSKHLEKPLKSVRTLYVLTKATASYEGVCEHLLSRLGVSPVIIESVSPYFPFPAVFAPFGTDEMCKTPDNCIMLGKGGFGLCCDEVFLGRKRFPYSIAAAIHLCIGTKESKNALPCFLEKQDRKYSPDGLRAKIKSSERLP